MIRLVVDTGVTLTGTLLTESPTGIKVKIDDGIPSWVPKSQVIARSENELVVTSNFARKEGLK